MLIIIPADIAHLFVDDPELGPLVESGQPFELTGPLCIALLQHEQRVPAADRAALEAFLHPLRDALLPTYAPVFTGPGLHTAQRNELNEWLQEDGPTGPVDAETVPGNSSLPSKPSPAREDPPSYWSDSGLSWLLAGLAVGAVAFGLARTWRK